MRFSCEKCNAQYAISDEKVGHKGVKVRCKKCGFIITVRPPTPAAEVPAVDKTQVDEPPQPTSSQSPAEAGAAAEAGGDEIGQALDAMFGREAPPADEQSGSASDEEEEDLDRQATRVFNVEEMQRVQLEKEEASRRASDTSSRLADIYQSARAAESGEAVAGEVPAPAADRESPQWWAAVNEQQIGPMSMAELEQRLQHGELDADTMVWKAGFADWMPVSEVAELRHLLSPARADEPVAKASAPSEEDFGLSAGSESASEPEENDLAAPEEEFSGSGRQIDYDEAEAAALSGTGVDWVPSGISELESLAESELACLRPKEAEEEPPPSEAAPTPEGEVSGETAPMDDGDSSIIEKLAREQQEAAAREEERKREAERLAAEAEQKERERQLEAQAAAQREREKEQREKASKPPEQVLPPAARVGWPRWLVFGGFGLGGVLVLLLAIVAYKLFTVPTPVLSNAVTSESTAPSNPAKSTEEKSPAIAEAKPPAVAAVAVAGPPEPAVPPSEKPPQEQPPTPAAEKTPAPVKTEPLAVKKAVVQPPKPRPETAPVRAARPAPAREEKKPALERELPGETEEEPKRPRKSGGGLLDFEDEAAFARETGSAKPVASAAPEPPPKKELPPLSNADVLGVMRQHLDEFKACNRKQQEIDPNVKGKMVVRFTVQPDGRVAQVVIETAEFKNTFVSECISKVIKQSHFPEFGGGPKTVPFPFTVK